MRKSMMVLSLLASISLLGCSAPSPYSVEALPDGTNNVPPAGEENWERIAEIPDVQGIYKVIDTEDNVICYYAISHGIHNSGIQGISCLGYYHEGSSENYRQVDG